MLVDDLVAAGKRTPASGEGGSSMNLEHCRKEAKALLRAFAARHAGALARAETVLGRRAAARFVLSDAQHVIAVERGYRSWPELSRAAARDRRAEEWVDCGLHYRPGQPVLVRVVRRPGRVTVSDERRALQQASASRPWRALADRLERELGVNISGTGAVWLPVVRVGPGEEAIIARIGRVSLRFYEDLLDLE
jgi:hypothetical protein